jgi:hypothetical protein
MLRPYYLAVGPNYTPPLFSVPSAPSVLNSFHSGRAIPHV